MARKKQPPEPTWQQKAIWLVWVKKTHPYTGKPTLDLRSVCSNGPLAELHKEMVIRDEPDAEAIWVEERMNDHLYGQRDVGLAFRMSTIGGKWERDRTSE